MRMKLRGAAIGAAALVAAIQPAMAQGRGALTSTVELEKSVPAVPGQPPAKSYVVPDVVVPGDRVRITLRFTNNGKEPATGVVINNPIPSALAFDGTSDTANFSVSVDKGHSFGPLSTLTIPVEGADPRPATAVDVTNVRWLLPVALPVGESVSVAFFGKVK